MGFPGSGHRATCLTSKGPAPLPGVLSSPGFLCLVRGWIVGTIPTQTVLQVKKEQERKRTAPYPPPPPVKAKPQGKLE